MAVFLASYLNYVPMACIAGILLWVSSNMIKPTEIKAVWNYNRFHAGLMVYTAVMVPMTDFLTGVLSALIIYAALKPIVERAQVVPERQVEPEMAALEESLLQPQEAN